MNTLMNLLARHAASHRLHVDAREWLLFLELDPTRAANVLQHLAILAAEDTGIASAYAAGDALRSAAQRANTPAGVDAAAVIRLDALGQRLSQARDRADTVWTSHLLPQLVQACVLTNRAAGRPPRSWLPGTAALPAGESRYPAQIASRRHRNSRRYVRLTMSTCQQLAADVTFAGWPPPRPLIVMDDDRPVLLIGADDLDTAWARDADVAATDRHGRVVMPVDWPWHTTTAHAAVVTPTVRRHRHAIEFRRRPARLRHPVRPGQPPLLRSPA
jgi:hypothetical protein